MKSIQSKTSKPANSNHLPFFQKESNNYLTNEKPFFNASPIYAKLNVNQPNDPYEKEADAMADRVVQRLSNKSFPDSNYSTPFFKKPDSTVQRKCAACEQEEKLQKKEDDDESDLLKGNLQKKPIFESNAEPPDDDENIQRKCAGGEKEDGKKLQPKPANNHAQSAPTSMESSLNASVGKGNPLPSDLSAQMGSSFNTDFSTVSIHNDSAAAQMSDSLNAQAFTYGQDIYFNRGKFMPGTMEGKSLLAHELAHTLQQKRDTGNTANNEAVEEREATRSALGIMGKLRLKANSVLQRKSKTEPVVSDKKEVGLKGKKAMPRIRRCGGASRVPTTARQVEFTGGYPMVAYGSDTKTNPVWTPGATDHAVAYSQNASPVINAQFNLGDDIADANVTSGLVRVKDGSQVLGQASVTPGGRSANLSGLTLSALTGSDGVAMREYNLSWEVSADGVQWTNMLTTGVHRIYWLFGAPLAAPLQSFAVNKATNYAAGAATIPAVSVALRSGVRRDMNYDPADPINSDPLSVFSDAVGICTDFGNILTLLALSVGLHANPVMFWGGFQSLGKNVWVALAGGYINLINVRSPNPAFNPPGSPGGWAFNYHVISRIEGVLQDAALDREGIDAQALHEGVIVRFLEIDTATLPQAKIRKKYKAPIQRKDHTIHVTIRDYAYPIPSSVFSTDIYTIQLPSPAPSPYNEPVNWSIVSGSILPPGLALDGLTGSIKGTPVTRGHFAFSVRDRTISGVENITTITINVV